MGLFGLYSQSKVVDIANNYAMIVEGVMKVGEALRKEEFHPSGDQKMLEFYQTHLNSYKRLPKPLRKALNMCGGGREQVLEGLLEHLVARITNQ